MICRTELHPKSSFFETRWYAKANLRMEHQRLDLGSDRIFGLRQPGKSRSPELFFDALKLIGPAKPWIGFYIDNRLATENVTNSRSVAQGNFFEPIHYVAQVVFTHLENLSDLSQGVPVRLLPAKPPLQRLRVKAPPFCVIANLHLRHLHSPARTPLRSRHNPWPLAPSRVYARLVRESQLWSA